MDNQSSSNIHTVLGVISLIVGVLGFIFSFIPCFGVYAIYAGIGGFLCGIGALVMAKKENAGIGLATAGIVMSILASAVALWQMGKMGIL
jgi:hypothetical protein